MNKPFFNSFLVVIGIIILLLQCVKHPLLNIRLQNTVRSPLEQRIEAIDKSLDQEYKELSYYRGSMSDNDLKQPGAMTQQQDYQTRIDALERDKESLLSTGCMPSEPSISAPSK